MTDREAMQMALDALTFCGDPEKAFDMEESAADALRARLAQPEPEPVAWGVIQRGKGVWFVNDSRFTAQHYANHYSHRDAAGFDQKVVPLYTAPPQREWQGLTDEEITEAMVFNKRVMAAHIEAKLKEKNT